MADTTIFREVDGSGHYIPIKAVDNEDGSFSYGMSNQNTTVLWAERDFTRPLNATPYAVNDVVSNSASATSTMTFVDMASKEGGAGYITKVRLETNQSTCVAQFRLWLYTIETPVVAADNALFTLLYANRGSRLGYLDIPALTTEATGSNEAMAQWTTTINGPFAFVTASNDTNLYGVLETKTAFTPASGQAFYVEMWSEVG
jgi:hypothetical protein